LLASVSLTLAHPVTGLPLTLLAPLADDFANALTALDMHCAVPRPYLTESLC
jgi:tRNA pseudouridine65 synthase